MNERIKLLALQARVQDRGYFIYQYGGPTGHQSVEKAIDLEKFAELIVLETLDQVNKNMELTWPEGEVKIKQYFGVK